VYPINSGNNVRMMGPTRVARFALGIHPVGMNKAVISPQAIKAPMFGMTIAARFPPNL
jgi:hypothetical protein